MSRVRLIGLFVALVGAALLAVLHLVRLEHSLEHKRLGRLPVPALN